MSDVKRIKRTEINATYFGGGLRDSVDVVLASEYDSLLVQITSLREALANAAHRVQWLMQFVDPTLCDALPIEDELTRWAALKQITS